MEKRIRYTKELLEKLIDLEKTPLEEKTKKIAYIIRILRKLVLHSASVGENYFEKGDFSIPPVTSYIPFYIREMVYVNILSRPKIFITKEQREKVLSDAIKYERDKIIAFTKVYVSIKQIDVPKCIGIKRVLMESLLDKNLDNNTKTDFIFHLLELNGNSKETLQKIKKVVSNRAPDQIGDIQECIYKASYMYTVLRQTQEKNNDDIEAYNNVLKKYNIH